MNKKTNNSKRTTSRRDFLKVTGGLATGTALIGLTHAQSKTDNNKPTTKAVSFYREIPIRHDVDVFIVGGGPAGVAAAIAARSQGVSVFVVEGQGCFGGMGTSAMVPAFMQLTDGINFLSGGVGRTVINRLKKETLQYYYGIDTEALKRVYDGMMTESGADFTFYTQMIDVETEGNRISHVLCSSLTGLFAVRAKIYIDCTGNGDLAVRAGASYEKGDENSEMMPGSLLSRWAGIDWKTWNANKPTIPQPDSFALEQAYKDGIFTILDEHLTGMMRCGDELGGGNIGHTFGVDGTDEVSLTKAMINGRAGLKEYEKYYRQYLKGFEKARLVATGALLGVRETRRIIGDYVLSLDDYKKRAVFEDEIGRYAYPIDNHPIKPGKDTIKQHREEFDQKYHYKKGESYGIPYRILLPKKVDNLFVAGRCVSADRMVHGSIRVMPACFITGQAAGMAAALVSQEQKTSRQIDISKLLAELKKFGAFLPNT
jgi:hypothetical protein